jgi:hypothetical protein
MVAPQALGLSSAVLSNRGNCYVGFLAEKHGKLNRIDYLMPPSVYSFKILTECHKNGFVLL